MTLLSSVSQSFAIVSAIDFFSDATASSASHASVSMATSFFFLSTSIIFKALAA